MPSNEVLLAGIGAVNLLLLIWQERTRRTAKRAHGAAELAKEQVQNDHDTNLREELDHRHAEVMTALEDLKSSDLRQWRYINELRDGRRARGQLRLFG